MIRTLSSGLPPAGADRAEPPLSDSAVEFLRQALEGFLPPVSALSHLFDRMETQR